ncbi:unnamed protein product [Amoebophrya sp. A120]|nr:unnamed protein product [Amoebophrya sp. A120]|eukprot:GSA120T00004407001.1
MSCFFFDQCERKCIVDSGEVEIVHPRPAASKWSGSTFFHFDEDFLGASKSRTVMRPPARGSPSTSAGRGLFEVRRSIGETAHRSSSKVSTSTTSSAATSSTAVSSVLFPFSSSSTSKSTAGGEAAGAPAYVDGEYGTSELSDSHILSRLVGRDAFRKRSAAEQRRAIDQQGRDTYCSEGRRTGGNFVQRLFSCEMDHRTGGRSSRNEIFPRSLEITLSRLPPQQELGLLDG